MRDEARMIVPALCDQIGVNDFVACGHSVGGGMAIETAAAVGDRCRAVITIAAQAFVEERTLEGIRRAKVEFRNRDNLAKLERYHGPKAGWVFCSWIDTWLSPEFSGYHLDEALSSIPCPVLAIHGDRDEYVSLSHPQRIASTARNGEAKILHDCGHVTHREREHQLTAIIADFLKRNDALA